MGMQWAFNDRRNVILYAREMAHQRSKQTLATRMVTSTRTRTKDLIINKQMPPIPENSIFVRIPDPFAPYKGGETKGGGNRMVFECLREVVGNPVVNRQRALGAQQEDATEEYDIYIAKVRKPWTNYTDEMSQVIQGAYAMDMQRTLPVRLMDWLVRFEAGDIVDALNYHYDRQARDTTYGYSESRWYHPNMMFVGLAQGTGAGFEFATWSHAALTYEANCAVNAASVVHTNPLCQMSVQALDRIRQVAEERNIQPFVGKRYDFIVILHPDQRFQLMLDEEFRLRLQNWGTEKADQSEMWVQHAVGVYNGMLIVEDWDLGQEVYPYDTTAANTPSVLSALDVTANPANADRLIFGPITAVEGTSITVRDRTDSRIKRRSTGAGYTANFDRRAGFLFGQDAAYSTRKRAPLFLSEDFDFEESKIDLVSAIYGWSRGDRYPNVSTKTTANGVVNESSIQFITASPVNNIRFVG